MSDAIDSTLEDLKSLFAVTDQVLSEWNKEGNLQFPVLLGMMAVRLNWDEEQVRQSDPIIRYYVRRHPDWHVTRGAGGGIMRASEKQKKDAEKQNKDAVRLAKEAARKQVETATAAKEAARLAATDSSPTAVE